MFSPVITFELTSFMPNITGILLLSAWTSVSFSSPETSTTYSGKGGFLLLEAFISLIEGTFDFYDALYTPSGVAANDGTLVTFFC